MGYLWENMEKMDIQLERRNTAEQRQRAEEAEIKLEEVEKKAEEAEQKARQEKLALYHILISTCQKQGISRESAKQKLLTEAGLEEAEADKLLEMFWENEPA